MDNEYKNLTGLTFHNWYVIKQGKDKYIGGGKNKPKVKKRTWICKCMCGFCNEVIRNVLESNLVNNKSKGCGKLTKILNGKNNKRYNKYDLTGEYGIGYTSKEEKFYFDLEDYDKIKKYCWCFLDKNSKYVMTNIKKNNSYEKLFLHNLIMDNIAKTNVVDHKNGKPYDNRKNNLRKCKQINNMKNLKLYKNNKSGYKGVHYLKNEDMWFAYIQYNKKRINLGVFKNKKEAIKTRKLAEKRYFGKYNREEKYL